MSKRNEKKENKLRQELEEQGFSQEEIDKVIQSRNKKKKIGKIITGIFALGVLITSVVVAVKNVNLTPTPPGPDNNNNGDSNESIKQIRDNVDPSKISKEESAKNKQILDDKQNNQEKSTDIVVPDNASEEEKKILEEKKEALKISEAIENIYGKNFKNVSDKMLDGQSTIVKINNIYSHDVVGDDMHVKCEIFATIETVDAIDGKLIKLNKLIKLCDDVDVNLIVKGKFDLVEYLSKNSNFDILITSYDNSSYTNIANKVLQDAYPNQNCEMLMFEIHKNPKNGNLKSIEYFVKKDNYIVSIKLSISKAFRGVAETDWENYAKNNYINSVQVSCEYYDIIQKPYNQTKIDEKAQAQEQKKSGAEAAAFEGMKDVGENGEMIGFDYNKYREYQDEKDAKEQQAQQNKIVEETKPLFPDFDLSL